MRAGIFDRDWGLAPGRRRTAAVVGASIALHALILFPLALRWAEPPAPIIDPGPIFIEMEPRPLLRGETAREPVILPPRSVETRPLTGAPPAATAPAIRPAAPASHNPSPLNPHLATQAPAAPAPDETWAVQQETTAAAVARTLRTGAGGCRIMDGQLSRAEQALCDERFNAAAARAGEIGARTRTRQEAARDSQFAREGARNLYRYESRRRPLSGGVGVVGPGDCPGSNFGTGCAGAHLDPAMRQGSRSTVMPGPAGNPDAMKPIPGNE